MHSLFILGYKKIFWLVKIGTVPVSVKFFCPHFPSSKDLKVKTMFAIAWLWISDILDFI